MRVTVTGATGIIGRRLVAALKDRNDEVTVFSRQPERAGEELGVEAVAWDPEARPAPAAGLSGRDAVVRVPAIFQKTFTLRELVRRGERVGPADDLPAWLEAVGVGRRPADLMGNDLDDDIADPIGQPDAAYEQTVGILDYLIDRLGVLLTPLAG